MGTRKRWVLALILLMGSVSVLGLFVDDPGGRILRFIGMGIALILGLVLWSMITSDHGSSGESPGTADRKRDA